MFGRWIDIMFVEDDLGRDVFFPDGRFSRGRIIDSKNQASRLKTHVTWLFYGQILLMIAVLVLFNDRFEILVLFPIFIYVSGQGILFFKVHRFPISDVRQPGFIQTCINMSRAIGAPWLWVNLLVLTVLDILFVGTLITSSEAVSHFIEFSLASVLGFGVLFGGPFFWGWMIYLRRSDKAKRP